MTFVEALIRFSLIHLGISYLIARSSILLSFRVAFMRGLATAPILQATFGALLYCLPCLGFWVGLAIAVANLYPFEGAWLIESAISGVAFGAIWNVFLPADTFDFERKLWAESESTLNETNEIQKDDKTKEIENE